MAIANVDGTPTAPACAEGRRRDAESAKPRFLRIDGRLPDRRAVVVHAAFFVKGWKVYHAAVRRAGEPARAEALETFFEAIRVVDVPSGSELSP